MSFADELQQASFRGVPFGVRQTDGKFGRRIALHEYPFRDKPWAEDIGRAARLIRVSGFLISDSKLYGGGDVLAQREQMIAACETADPGTLVHPTLGELTVSLHDGVVITERWNEGRYFELNFEFVESGERTFPAAASDTGAATDDAADDLDGAATDDFSNGLDALLDNGPAIIDMVIDAVADWSAMVLPLVADATGLAAMVGALPGSFGRYFGGRMRGFGTAQVPPSSATIVTLIAQGAAARAVMNESVTALTSAAAGGEPDAIAVAAQNVAATLAAAMVDPADGVRLLSRLADYYPARFTSAAPMGLALAAAQTATGAMLRRTALAALARATALYQPASQDDAASVRDSVAGLLADEVMIAGDSGEDASYLALKILRASVVADLSAKGAALPAMREFRFGAALPSLVLANRIYRDPTRADELVIEANPIHPAFLPPEFRALAS
jgi:prophage DNA circulation protein